MADRMFLNESSLKLCTACRQLLSPSRSPSQRQSRQRKTTDSSGRSESISYSSSEGEGGGVAALRSAEGNSLLPLYPGFPYKGKSSCSCGMSVCEVSCPPVIPSHCEWIQCSHFPHCTICGGGGTSCDCHVITEHICTMYLRVIVTV